MHLRKWWISTVCTIILCLWADAAFPQGTQGTIRGTVVDLSGGVVPGATVTLTNMQTGDVREQLSTEAGLFHFPNLPLAIYQLKVSNPGFKIYERPNIEVKANQTIDQLVRLEIGSVSEIVTVTEGTEQVTTSTAQLEGYTSKTVTEIPISDIFARSENLAILAPGTTTQSGGVVGQGGSIGGNRPRMNNFVVDGVDNNDPGVTGPLAPVIQEAVEEFTLLTNQFSAEYGHSTAGQFITTTRSGTNELHGRAWWHSQNRNTNALDNITRAATAPGDPKPRYDWNRFGGQAGGPVLRDKWFFFGSYEYRNLTQAGTSSGIIYVPTAAGLSALESLAQTPGSGVSPVNVGIISQNVPVAGSAIRSDEVLNEATGQMVPIEIGQFSASTPNFDRTHLYLISSDYQTRSHRISGRFHYSRNRLIQAGELPVAQFNSNVQFDTKRATLGDVWTVSPRMVNELRFGWNHSKSLYPVDLPAAPGTTDVFANYDINDLNLFIGPNSNYPQGGSDNVYQFADNLSFTRGAHTFKGGFEVRNIISIGGFLPRARGEYQWTNLDNFVRDRFPTAVSIRGVGSGVFSQNRAAFYGYFQDSWKIHPRISLEIGARYEYTQVARDSALQDLNGIASVLSIREEVYTADLVGPDSPLLGQKIFDTLPAYHQEALLKYVGESLIFRRPRADRNNFAPRAGLAWDLFGDGRTSLRAGFGVAHDVIYGNLPQLQMPPQLQAENRETNACLLSPRPAWCSQVGGGSPLDADIRYSSVGFIDGGGLLPTLPPDALIDKYTARAATQGYVMDETTPETYTWTLSLQHQLFNDFLLEGRYVGTHAIHLPIQRWVSAGVPNPYRLPVFFTESEALNQSFAGAPTLADFQNARDLLLAPYGFGGVITQFTPDGQSWYHGGSFAVQKRFSSGLALNANYTWSRAIDLIENDLFTSFMNPRRPFDHLDIFSNKGLSGLNHSHKFAVTWMYDLPFMNAGTGWMRKAFGGWQLNGTYLAETGQPLTIISRQDLNGDFDTAGDTAIENPNGIGHTGTDVNFVCWNGSSAGIAGSAEACGGAANVVGYTPIDPTARYIRGELGAQTNMGRNTFLSPGINNWNLSMFKKIPVGGEGKYVQFRVEMWNAFNHPSFGIGRGNAFSLTNNATGFPAYVTPGTGQFLDEAIFSGGMGNAPFQRVIQWGLKFIF